MYERDSRELANYSMEKKNLVEEVATLNEIYQLQYLGRVNTSRSIGEGLKIYCIFDGIHLSQV